MKGLLIVLAAAIACLSWSQAPTSQPRFGKAVRSPEISQDRRVTFRFLAPNAKTVRLDIEGTIAVPLTKDERGVWSGTTGALDPDLYIYSFIVDGVALADPSNPNLKPIATGGAQSIVEVTGATPQLWEAANVPHGVLHRHTYWSKTVGEVRRFLVYTPPGYDPSGRMRYPVLYLLHGVMETEDGWIAAGRADAILDNLVYRHLCEPMLIVMPLGYGFANVPDRMIDQFNLSKQRPLMDAMGQTLFAEVIPAVERTYKVRRGTEGRAVAGCSMGGAQALYFGRNHPEVFGAIGSFSGAFIMYSGGVEAWMPSRIARPKQALIMACGKDDFLFATDRKVADWVKSKGAAPDIWETPGGHTWNVWRRNIVKFLPLLFRVGAKASAK